MQNNKEDFCAHLSRLGFEIGAPREWVHQKFRRYLGPERFAQLQQITNMPHNPERANRAYDFVRDTTEANLMRSLDPDVTVETSYQLYRMSLPLLQPGARVLELACWTGALASFIASNHPQCRVMGVDRVDQLIGMDRAQHQLSNLSFHTWDYREAKPAKVPPADVVLCGLGINNLDDGGYENPDTHSPRGTAGYRRHKTDALVYFSNWRSAARDNAALFAVLRICTFGRFIAFLDAAQESGWAPQLDQCVNVPIPTAKEHLPALAFRAAPSEPVAEDEALTHFVRLSTIGNPYLQAVGPLALALYQSLAPRKVLYSHTVKNLGCCTFEEVGTAGATGYVFCRDSRPQYQFSVVSVTEAEGIKRKLCWQEEERRRLTEHPIEGAFVINSQPLRGLQVLSA